MSKMSRRIVVDASVAGAAGERSHPTSQMCRQFLLDMLTICHKAVMSPEISVEWKNHASKYSVNWLAAMRSKGKIVTIAPGSSEGIARHFCDDMIFTPNQISAMEKDLLLILAALQTDRLVASCDRKVRELFAQAALAFDDIKNIMWVDPSQEGDDCSHWLESGARHSPGKCLGKPQQA